MRKFPLVKLTDDHFTRSRFSTQRNDFMNPSAARVSWVDPGDIKRTAGACHRAQYYQRTGVEGAPHDPYTKWMFSLGSAVETILVEQYKQMGIWVDNNIKFYDPVHGISGEMDVLVKDPATGQLVILEIKSLAGYKGIRDVIKGTKGNSKTQAIVPAPKTSQLLQTVLYLDIFKDKVAYAKMVYYCRDTADRREFDITLHEEGDSVYPCVDGKVDYRFSVQDIYDSYTALKEALDSEQLPPRDYEIKYSAAEIEKRKAAGDPFISAPQYKKWKEEGVPIGDWMCNYCGFSSTCYGKDK